MIMLEKFVKTEPINKFVRTIFGDKPYFYTGKDTILKSQEEKETITFSISFFNRYQQQLDKNWKLVFSMSLPDLLENKNFSSILREEFQKLNNVRVTYWQIEFNWSTSFPEEEEETPQREDSLCLSFSVKFIDN